MDAKNLQKKPESRGTAQACKSVFEHLCLLTSILEAKIMTVRMLPVVPDQSDKHNKNACTLCICLSFGDNQCHEHFESYGVHTCMRVSCQCSEH